MNETINRFETIQNWMETFIPKHIPVYTCWDKVPHITKNCVDQTGKSGFTSWDILEDNSEVKARLLERLNYVLNLDIHERPAVMISYEGNPGFMYMTVAELPTCDDETNLVWLKYRNQILEDVRL